MVGDSGSSDIGGERSAGSQRSVVRVLNSVKVETIPPTRTRTHASRHSYTHTRPRSHTRTHIRTHIRTRTHIRSLSLVTEAVNIKQYP